MDVLESTSTPVATATSSVSVGLDPALRASLPSLAAGRSLVIDSYRFWQCGSWAGDLTVEWRDADPGPTFAALAPIDGVPLFASRRLVRVLRDGGAVLQRGRLPFRRGFGISLRQPALWIDYLEHPASFDQTDEGEPDSGAPGA